jgi:hypothetical protein
MAFHARRVEYFHTTVIGEPEQAYDLLTQLANLGVNLLALNSVPMGPESTQLTLFPEESSRLQNAARSAGLTLVGPHAALLVSGDDEPGALARVHARLHKAGVDVYASVGVTDGKGGFGYVLYLRGEEAERAVAALKG